MVGVRGSEWLQFRHNYLENIKQPKQETQPLEDDIVTQAENLFGKDALNIID